MALAAEITARNAVLPHYVFILRNRTLVALPAALPVLILLSPIT